MECFVFAPARVQDCSLCVLHSKFTQEGYLESAFVQKTM
jgi:hypothetical protein